MVEPLYQIKATCLHCESEFQTSRVRPSFKKVAATESDFFIRYKEDNPDYYVVRVCPTCGFASTENFSELFLDKQKAVYRSQMSSSAFRDFGGQRSWSDALQTYKLALLCAQIKGEKERILAGLLHHIAWLYREKGEVEQEKRFLEYALGSYIKVFETEGDSLNNARLMYLIGELSRRLGKYHEAVRWFVRIIQDKRIMDSAMIRASREQWRQSREEMIAARLIQPDEMKEPV